MRAGWEYKKLGEVCADKKQIKRAAKCFSSSEQIQYIDISSIDNSTQKMTELTTISMEEAPSRAQQKVEMNDILISTVRPNLKNIAIVDRDDSNLVASSGFCVLRTSSVVEQRYVFYFVTSDLYTNHLVKLTTGANYPAVRDQDILDSFIPLPPIPQQRLIVSELDEINSLIALKREQLKKYDELAQSLFYEMFGDPVENEKGWVVKKLGEVTVKTAFNGQIQSVNDRCWLLNLDMVESQTGKIISKVYVTKDEIGNSTTSFNEEYVLYSKLRPYLNKVVLPDTSGYCTTELVPIKPQEGIDRCYLCYLLRSSSFVNMITIKVAGAKMPRVTMSDFWEFMFPLPPLSLQRLFAHRIEQIEEQKKQISAAIAQLETLLASRMQYWFE